MAQNFAQAAAVAVPSVAEERGQLKVYYPSAGDSPNHYPRGPGPNNEVISLVDISDEEDDSSQAQRRRRRRRNKRLRDPFMNQLQEAVARGGRRVKPAYPDGSYNVLGGNMEPFDPSRFKSDPNERDNAPDPVVPKLPPAISTAEAEVLSVFGDIEISHLKLLLSQNSYRPDAVVSLLLDAPSYPRAQETTSQAPAGSSLLKLDDSPEWTYDFTSPTSFAAYPKTPYTIEAVQLLLNLLPLGAINPVRAMLRNCSWHYAICHDRIITALKSGTDDELEQYRQVKQVLEDGTFQRPDQKQALALLAGICLGKCFIRSRRAPKSVVVTDPTLLEECQYVDRKLQEYLSTMKVRSERERRKQEADLMGVSLECSCCFDTYAYEDMIACITKGHLFCLECLDTYGKNKMWGDGNFGTDKTKKPLLDLLCFHGDGCSSSFDRRSLEKAMEPKNFKKYDELQCQLVVDQVLGDELASCPKCNYQAAVPTGQNIFSCPVQGCRFESCRGCGEAAHIPLRCDEIKKKEAEEGRVTVEEAISQAKIRRCPNARCNKPFLKSDGCNKITCACGTLICYVCRAIIKDYTHFCQTPHCAHASCNKCSLWTKGDEDDVRAMRDAGLLAAAKVASSTTTGVNINVDEILEAGTRAK